MIRRLFLTLLTAFSLSDFAQVSSLGMDTTYSIPTQVTYNQVIQIQIGVVNTGTITVNDTVQVTLAVDTDTTTLTSWVTDTSIIGYVSNFTVGSVQSFSFNDSITNQLFKPGVNPVVIWPKAFAPGSVTSDSLFVTIFIDTATGMKAPGLLKGFTMFPNPSKDFLYFNSLTPDHPYKKIKFYDMEGRLVMEAPFTAKVDVTLFRPGLYTVAVETLNGEQRKLKFLKE